MRRRGPLCAGKRAENAVCAVIPKLVLQESAALLRLSATTTTHRTRRWNCHLRLWRPLVLLLLLGCTGGGQAGRPVLLLHGLRVLLLLLQPLLLLLLLWLQCRLLAVMGRILCDWHTCVG